jgi:enoyl reductase-like protein
MFGNRKMGRKKRIKEAQIRPLIVSAARSRVSETVLMSAPAARELREYVKWAATAAMLPEDEATVLTLDRALTEFFRRDTLWKAHKERASDTAETEVARAPASSTSAQTTRAASAAQSPVSRGQG